MGLLQNDLVCAGVLSGNRNFEGRIHPNTRANYLASPLLVIAYAIAGRVQIDFETEPLGTMNIFEMNINYSSVLISLLSCWEGLNLSFWVNRPFVTMGNNNSCFWFFTILYSGTCQRCWVSDLAYQSISKCIDYTSRSWNWNLYKLITIALLLLFSLWNR